MTVSYSLDFSGPLVTVSLSNVDPDCEIAFYAFRNGDRAEVRRYEKNPVFTFDTKNEPGCYNFKYFIAKDGSIKSTRTTSHYLNERRILMSAPEEEIARELKSREFLPCALEDDCVFNALFSPRDNKRLFVLLPSAPKPKAIKSRPLFFRSHWMMGDLFKGNILCVADPVLMRRQELSITWMIGDEKKDYLKALAKIVKKLAASLGIEEIVFYGSSAGGFDAISLAYEIDGSTAIAINPQTCVLDYYLAAHVDKFRRSLFNNMSREEIRSRFADRVDLKAKHFSATKSRIAIIQNLTDIPHYYFHFLPFWSALSEGAAPLPVDEGKYRFRNHVAWLYNMEGGHIGETKEMCAEILNYLNLDQ